MMIGRDVMIEPNADSATEGHSQPVGRPQSYDEINVKAAISRAQILLFSRIAQDIVSRAIVFFLLNGAFAPNRNLSMPLFIVIFCAIWFISRERLSDTIDQIENAFVRRAQGQVGTTVTAKWEYFLAAVGARATSRKSISVFESTLRFEPLI